MAARACAALNLAVAGYICVHGVHSGPWGRRQLGSAGESVEAHYLTDYVRDKRDLIKLDQALRHIQKKEQKAHVTLGHGN